MATDEYVLGTDAVELRRLEFQHKAWVAQAFALWQRAGLRGGDVVLDLGCGPGYTTLELAHVVGGNGKVIARDQSEGFLRFLTRERDARGLAQIEPSLGSVETLDLADASLDGVYARWLFCWLADPVALLGRVARAVRPGGVIVLQEYLDWAAMKLVPRHPAFDRAVDACMRSWRLANARIDVAEDLIAAAPKLGLSVQHVQPIARLGAVGSLEWRWVSEFFHAYLPKLAAHGLLTPSEIREALSTLEPRADTAKHVVTPTMCDLVLARR